MGQHVVDRAHGDRLRIRFRSTEHDGRKEVKSIDTDFCLKVGCHCEIHRRGGNRVECDVERIRRASFGNTRKSVRLCDDDGRKEVAVLKRLESQAARQSAIKGATARRAVSLATRTDAFTIELFDEVAKH